MQDNCANKLRKINLRQSVLDIEPPEKKLITDGDLFLKKLAEKQSNRKTNLQIELSRPQEFKTGTSFLSLSNFAAGSSSLENFLSAKQNSEELEKLQSLGLSQHDAELYTAYKSGNLSENFRKINSEALFQHIKFIEEQLLQTESPAVHHNGNTIRELIPYEQSSSASMKLFKFAQQNESKIKETLPHPMDSIKQVEDKLKNDLANVNPKIIRRKARKLRNRLEKSVEPTKDEPKLILSNKSLAKESKWDLKEITSDPPTQVRKTYTCKSQNFYTIKDGTIVKINATNNINVPKKLSEEEIRRIPKFENYDPGSPSKTLFLKNLPNKIVEQDLTEIFEKSNADIIAIKVMNGKMRGQAFLEVKDEESAGKILHMYNGTVVKNKPMIIQFGRKNHRTKNE